MVGSFARRAREHAEGDVHHLEVARARVGRDLVRARANVVGDGALDPRDHGMRALGEDLSGGWRGTDGGRVRSWTIRFAGQISGRRVTRRRHFRRAASVGKIALNPSGGRGEIASGRASSKRAGRRGRSTRTIRSRRSATCVFAVAPEPTSSRTSSFADVVDAPSRGCRRIGCTRWRGGRPRR